MPFVAKHKDTGERCYIPAIDNPRDRLKYGDWVCQNCGQPLFIREAHLRKGYLVRAHAVHMGPCDGKYEPCPQSLEHLWAKAYLAQVLKQEYERRGSKPQIDVEMPIDMDWRPRGRIVDVLVTWPMGWRVAYEIQLASITPQELQDRTNDYARSGIDVVWLMGADRKSDTPQNRAWCIREFGYYYRISYFKVEDFQHWPPEDEDLG